MVKELLNTIEEQGSLIDKENGPALLNAAGYVLSDADNILVDTATSAVAQLKIELKKGLAQT